MWIWLLFALAICSSVMLKPKVTLCLAGVTLLAALLEGRLSLLALGYVLIGAGIAFAVPKMVGRIRYIGYLLIIIWCVALSMHLIPGFENLKVLDSVIAKPQSTPFSMYLNLDKPLVFFALLMMWPALLGKARRPDYRLLTLTLVALFSLLPVAVFLGALKPQVSLPEWWWLFVINNLLFTCVAEEAFFRGFLQQGLSKRFGIHIGLIVASVLFGLAHFNGGALLIIFATLAGIGYGVVFHLTGRLWVAVLTHFMFNFAHLTFFTYPLLAHSSM